MSSSSQQMVSGSVCPEMYLSYGVATLKGMYPDPELTVGATAVPSFTLMSPLMGLDYFGVYEGLFGAYSAKHLEQRLHIAVAMKIHDELVEEEPRFLRFPDDLEGWWKKTVQDAFCLVDDELVARAAGGAAFGCPAVFALVLKDYLVLASRGVTCRAVIYRGEEAVQLTPERRPDPEPYKQTEQQQDVQDTGRRMVESTCNLQDNTTTSPTILFRPFFPNPKVLMIEREPRDKFLILATASVWDYVSPSDACRFIQNKLPIMSRINMPGETALHVTGSRNMLAKELAEHAISKGSEGNVTVAVILFKNF